MIKINVNSPGYDLDDELRERITDGIGGLDTYMNTLDEGRVTLSWEGGHGEQTRVLAQVWGAGQRFEASDTDWKPITAVDRTRHELETQIRREHGKQISERDR